MRKNSFIVNLSLSTLMMLAVAFLPILSKSSYAQSPQCVTSDVRFLSTGPTSQLVYWEANDCNPGSNTAVYYATSFDKLNTLSEPQLLFGPLFFVEFDGIISGGSNLVASYANVGGGGPTIYVYVSGDRGKTWSGPLTVAQFGSSAVFAGCPVLDSGYDEQLKRFILRTHINTNGSSKLYIFSSTNGTSWTSSTIDAFPAGCQED